MPHPERRFIVICSSEEAQPPAPATSAVAGGGAGCADYIRELCGLLRRLGHHVELWTIQRDGQPAIESGPCGVLIRRFPGQRDHLVPRLRPCWWVSEWVAGATAYLASCDDPIPTLVTFRWEAGIAGRLLAERFGLDLVHVPDLAIAGCTSDECRGTRISARHDQEERETCRLATLVVATSAEARQALLARHYLTGDDADKVALVHNGPETGAGLLAALAASPARSSPVSASAAADGTPDDVATFPVVPHDRASALPPRHARWRFELELAKYALLGGRPMF